MDQHETGGCTREGRGPSEVKLHSTEENEMKALTGLMLTSTFKSGDENKLSLFSTDSSGCPIFQATISFKQFEILISFSFDSHIRKHNRK
jgi:hypothetical protein